MLHRIRSIIGSSMGNILEWYDFGLFAIFSPFFSQLFFPNSNPHAAMIYTLGIFAIGFICRPLGALVFGYLGDRRGRASTLRLSILMISLPTLFIALLPTWSQAGVIAPILLMLVRIWQGISLGGEYSGNLIYLAETAPAKLRATFTSFAGTGANLGILLATMIGGLCAWYFAPDTLKSWGWRIPYLISGVLSLFIYLTRLNMDETDIFEFLKKKHQLADNPITVAFQRNKFHMLRTFGLVCLTSTYYYFTFAWLPLYLKTNLHLKTAQVSWMISGLIAAMLVLVPMAGWLCDQIGRRRLFLFNALSVALLVIPGLYFLQLNHFAIIFGVMLIFTLIGSLDQATTSISVVENFPVPARYTGLSLSYNLGNGVLGGTVPLICTFLSDYFHYPLAPAFYIMFCALITATVVWFYMPETRFATLTETA